MKHSFVSILFISVSIITFSQTINILDPFNNKIKLPALADWKYLDSETLKSTNPSTKSYSILFIYQGVESFDNTFSVYGDSSLIHVKPSLQEIIRLKQIFEKGVLSNINKNVTNYIPFEKVLNVYKEYYKNSPQRYEDIAAKKDSVISTLMENPRILTPSRHDKVVPVGHFKLTPSGQRKLTPCKVR